MAVTPVVSAGDGVMAAKVNQFVGTPGKEGVLLAFGRVYYDGAAWVLDTAHDSFGLSTPTFSNPYLSLSLTNRALAGIPHVTQCATASTVYMARAHTTSAGTLQINFVDMAGTLITAPTTSMDVYITVKGI